MSGLQKGNVLGVTAKGGTGNTNINGGDNDDDGFTLTGFANIGAMKTRLAAINGTTFTAARLNTMTYNDMVYALRVNDHPTSI